MNKFPFYRQLDSMTCGAACLKMLLEYYNIKASMQDCVEEIGVNKQGSTFLGIKNAAKKHGLSLDGFKVSLNNFFEIVDSPAIIHCKNNHFVLLYKVYRNYVLVADPSDSIKKVKKSRFITRIEVTQENCIHLMFCNSEPDRKILDYSVNSKVINMIKVLSSFFRNHKKQIFILFFSLVIGSAIQFILPLLNKEIVDQGIMNKDIWFIYYILLFQICILFGRAIFDAIRVYITTKLGMLVSLDLTKNFFHKILLLPFQFFFKRQTGDLLQRIQDSYRIEYFLTNTLISFMFSTINLIIFSIVIILFSKTVFLVFISASMIYLLWNYLFLKRRGEIDNERFNQASNNQSRMIEILYGIVEIKLFNAERDINERLNKDLSLLNEINLKSIKLLNLQNLGGALINEIKNIIITFYTAKLVISGEITIGTMLSIGFIIGQLNVPVAEFINFIRGWQDFKLSFDRINEVMKLEGENSNDFSLTASKYEDVFEKDLFIKDMSFNYEGNSNESNQVLRDVNLTINKGKVTAIVGHSGCGKSTFLKIILRFFIPAKGTVMIGDIDINKIPVSIWRSSIGAVMQDGYLFNESIKYNICLGSNEIDYNRLYYSAGLANIYDDIMAFPKGFDTIIGFEGRMLSKGQLQRILIARIVYKNPRIILLDEATSALDSENELIINENLKNFFNDKTVIIVAHRLSTIKAADQIVVFKNGEVVEVGSHNELLSKQTHYFKLYKNQLNSY